MAQRYYIARIIGTGSSNDPFRPLVADRIKAASCKFFIPVNTFGVPIRNFALCVVDADSHTSLQNDPNDILPLPTTSLDVQPNAATRTAMAQLLTKAGLASTTATSYRQWLNKVGKQFDAAFDVDVLKG